ncbi:MAG: UDP-4-amino-4,6-dideoxy-N-acetyl-beta-L-altrosamine transaminase [Bacteroidia bacterium]|nr:UDP-4-amino-4,6-dideoxy-N-acetyl-beta-L-altrosamine transaminase [Bacteroidia bacterium]
MPIIPYGRQHITEEDIAAVTAALRDEMISNGPRVQALEQAFAAYTGATYAVAVSSGTAALHLCASALGVKPGTRVLTTPNTFVATPNCVLYCGGTVDLVDIDPDRLVIDLDLIEQKLVSSPPGTYAGIIPVDFAGLPVDMERLRLLADRHGCWIIEDACHAPGGYFCDTQGRTVRCGSGQYADLAIFSFHPVKHITSGEGGIITTHSKHHYEHLLRLRNHGMIRKPDQMVEYHGGWHYEVQELGFNYRLTDIQAALAASQLQRAEANLARRRALAARYHAALADLPLILPPDHPGHAWHLYVIQTRSRRRLYHYLHQHDIRVQVHYVPVHYHPLYRRMGWTCGDFPHTEHYYESCLSLPMYHALSDEDQDHVIAVIRRFFQA